MKFTPIRRQVITTALVMALGTGSPAQADIEAARHLQQETGVLQDYRRLLPLDGGSNFRDMGGYPTMDGSMVKRGLLFRSAAMSSLTESDAEYLAQLGIESVMDLRSSEELELFPNSWAKNAGIAYHSHDYSIFELLGGRSAEELRNLDMATMYEGMPLLLKPQLQQYFALLLEARAPLVVNCSAGQDRTGIISALLLSALGVPRQLVLEDYLLSSDFRRPQVERGDVDLAAHAQTNAFAALMANYSQAEQTHAAPLVTTDGEPYLVFALRRIEADYGSIEAFLEREAGVDADDIARLRQLYLD